MIEYDLDKLRLAASDRAMAHSLMAQHQDFFSIMESMLEKREKPRAKTVPFPDWQDVKALQVSLYDNGISTTNFRGRWGVDVRAWTFIPSSKKEWAKPSWEAEQRLWLSAESKRKAKRAFQRKTVCPFPMKAVEFIAENSKDYDALGLLEREYVKDRYTEYFYDHYAMLYSPMHEPILKLNFPNVDIGIFEWTSLTSSDKPVPLKSILPTAYLQYRYSSEPDLKHWVAGSAEISIITNEEVL